MPSGTKSIGSDLSQKLAMCSIGCQTHGMHNELSKAILQIVERLPHWIRQDLSSKDEQTKLRADEALSAILAAQLEPHWDGGSADNANAHVAKSD